VEDAFDDFAIIRVNNVPGWRPRNWVYVHSSADTVIDPDYTISGVSTSPVGTPVCLSGANSGTDCGDVVELDWNGPNGFAMAEYCSESGDSGGAVYSNHKAGGSTSVASRASSAASTPCSRASPKRPTS
jgi:hypothetical protein